MEFPVLLIANLAAIFLFAPSGALAAAHKQMGVLGYMELACF